MPRLAASFLLLILTAPVAPLAAQEKTPATADYDAREHYTKSEYRIPMRDGTLLFTAVYAPKDQSKKYPFLITRTPYGIDPYGVEHYPRVLGPTADFDRAGYIFVDQDVRGRFLSGDSFVEMRPQIDQKKSAKDVDESSDLSDTIDWLLKNIPNHNGKAGLWGISYPGFYTAAGLIDSPPALKAASPQAPIADLYQGDDAYHNGAFMLAAEFEFYTFFRPQKTHDTVPKDQPDFDFGTHDGYQYYLQAGSVSNLSARLGGDSWLWDDQWRHDTYDDYWQSRSLLPHLKNIHCAVLNVGGWFDAEDLSGPFKTYAAIEKNNPGIANSLVIGPWSHGGWGDLDGRRLGHLDFASNTGDFYRQHILFPFFEQHLRDGPDAQLPEAWVFETGTNVWKKYPAWPPKEARPKMLYFRENGQLSFDPPTADAPAGDEYLSDPAKPVPLVHYTALNIPREYMVSDQRFACTRPDVLTYESPVLENDLTVTGPVAPHLFVSTSGTDSDFDVKLIDVHPTDSPESQLEPEHPGNDVAPPVLNPAGFAQLVRGEPFRGKFRRSFSKPEAFVPGQVEVIDFAMPDINHTFRRGHRIMVQVQSSWFPLTDRNPQTFGFIPEAKPADFVKATERIYRNKTQPSGLSLPVLP